MLNSIQSLRGIFVLMIFLSHVGICDFGGDGGVSFFLVLSGFVLCDGYQQRLRQHVITYKSFIRRRIAKIYPLHLLCFVCAFFLPWIHDHNPAIWLSNLLLLQSWSPAPEVHFSANSVSWFLSVMIFCYLLFPLIMRLIDRSQRYFFLAASMLLAVYFVVIQFVPDALFNGLIYINPLFRLPDFILGVIIWQLIGRSLKTDSPRVPKFSFAVASAIELSVIALFTLTVVAYGFVSLRYGLVSLWWPASLAFIGIFALFNDNGGIVSRVFRLRPLVSFGNVSFSFYMVHVLVIQVARWSLKNMPSGAISRNPFPGNCFR